MEFEITSTDAPDEPILEMVFHWWNSEFPVQLRKEKRSDFDHWMSTLGNRKHYLVKWNDTFSGWAMTFNRDGERWFSILIPERAQGHRLGSKLMQHITSRENPICGWVITQKDAVLANGQKYRSPIQFYTGLGFRQTNIHTEIKDGLFCEKIVFDSGASNSSGREISS